VAEADVVEAGVKVLVASKAVLVASAEAEALEVASAEEALEADVLNKADINRSLLPNGL
jgi:hypothetical protein